MVLLLDNSKGTTRFGDSDIFYTLDYLSDGKKVGRQHLADVLEVGEGSMRGMLEILAQQDLVRIERGGVSITETGLELLSALGVKTVDLYIPIYVLGKHQQAIVVYDASERVFNGIEQRNAGIRAGGDGCSTWVMKDGRIIMLPKWDMDEYEPAVAAKIRRCTGMTDGDVLIIGGGDTKHVAMMAACDAALQLV